MISSYTMSIWSFDCSFFLSMYLGGWVSVVDLGKDTYTTFQCKTLDLHKKRLVTKNSKKTQ